MPCSSLFAIGFVSHISRITRRVSNITNGISLFFLFPRFYFTYSAEVSRCVSAKGAATLTVIGGWSRLPVFVLNIREINPRVSRCASAYMMYMNHLSRSSVATLPRCRDLLEMISACRLLNQRSGGSVKDQFASANAKATSDCVIHSYSRG